MTDKHIVTLLAIFAHSHPETLLDICTVVGQCEYDQKDLKTAGQVKKAVGLLKNLGFVTHATRADGVNFGYQWVRLTPLGYLEVERITALYSADDLEGGGSTAKPSRLRGISSI